MAKLNWKGGALLAPIPPAMISCGSMEKPNIITIAWTGILGTIPPKTYISVRPSRHSYDLIKQSGEFVINLTTTDLVRAADFCGVRSGKEVDKFAQMKLTPEKSPLLDCPMIAESPISIQCRVCSIVPMGSHDMFMADIIGVCVDEKYVDKNGKLTIDRCKLAAFAHGEYFALGQSLGTFGFSVKKGAVRTSVPKKNHTAQASAPAGQSKNKPTKSIGGKSFAKNKNKKHKTKGK